MIKELIISITSRCNLRCKMCDIPSVRSEELETGVWKQVIRDAGRSGVSAIVFSGGEPLLREDLFDLISFTKEQNMMACVTSNGLLIDELCARRLSEAGVDVVNVSLEGPEEVHDQLRGQGSFDSALLAIKNLRKYKIERTIATVVTSRNFKHLPYIVKLAQQYGVTALKFQPFSSLFLKTGKRGEDFFLIAQDSPAFFESIKKVIWLCRSYGISTNPGKYFDEMSRYLVKRSGNIQHHCPALFESCPINAKGEVYPCWVLTGPEYLIGNIKGESFSDIWSSSRRAGLIKKICQRGCQGCLLSCYDDNYGKAGLDEKISRDWGLLRRYGLLGYLHALVKRWKKRWRFYVSWRGSVSSALRRVKAKLKKMTGVRPPTEKKGEELRAALKELRYFKKLFEKESESMR